MSGLKINKHIILRKTRRYNTIIQTQYRIAIVEDSVKVTFDNRRSYKFNRICLPDLFLRWQSEARLRIFGILKKQGAEAVKTQPAHLPVLATLGDKPFSANLSTKGDGLVPKPDYLNKFINLFEQTKAQAKGKPLPETLPIRIEAAQNFYNRLENFDPFMLGGLEIFEGQTARNIHRDPMASLLYTGEAPRFPSFQFNTVITIIGSENLYYRFLLAARELFAFDSFHIPQTRYPYGYLFRVVEIHNKTPYKRR